MDTLVCRKCGYRFGSRGTPKGDSEILLGLLDGICPKCGSENTDIIQEVTIADEKKRSVGGATRQRWYSHWATSQRSFFHRQNQLLILFSIFAGFFIGIFFTKYALDQFSIFEAELIRNSNTPICAATLTLMRRGRLLGAFSIFFLVSLFGIFPALLFETALRLTQQLPKLLFTITYHRDLFVRLEASYLKWQKLSVAPIFVAMFVAMLVSLYLGDIGGLNSPAQRAINATLLFYFFALTVYGFLEAKGGIGVYVSRPFLARYSMYCILGQSPLLASVIILLFFCYPFIIEMWNRATVYFYFNTIHSLAANIQVCSGPNIGLGSPENAFRALAVEMQEFWSGVVVEFLYRLLRSVRNPQIIIWGITAPIFCEVFFPLIKLRGWKTFRLVMRFLISAAIGYAITWLFSDVELIYRLIASLFTGFTVTIVLSLILRS